MSQSLEYEDVRKLASELAARLPPGIILPQTFPQLVSYLQSKDVIFAKAFLFHLCNSLILYERQTEPFEVHTIIPLLLGTLLSQGSSEEWQKLQFGCIDCLAIILKVTLPAKDIRTVKEVEDIHQMDDLFPFVLFQVSSSSHTSLR